MPDENDGRDQLMYARQARQAGFDHHIDSLYAAISERSLAQSSQRSNDNGRYSPISGDDDNVSLSSVSSGMSRACTFLQQKLVNRNNEEKLEKRTDEGEQHDQPAKDAFVNGDTEDSLEKRTDEREQRDQLTETVDTADTEVSSEVRCVWSYDIFVFDRCQESVFGPCENAFLSVFLGGSGCSW